ncbi:Alpha-2-macroglobulin receptor-associated protein [Varanus komodoensis]|nr:Alpha-2-macroglobulin receptor-associated protein [Varanus komodoensis]
MDLWLDYLHAVRNEGFGGREFGGPVCILSNADIRDQSMDLHTIDRILCQYNLCFKHFESVIREFNTLQNSYELCWKFLHQLENTIKKMKRQPPASCTALWSYNDSRWDEITKVPHLTQELLKYLEYLRPACH